MLFRSDRKSTRLNSSHTIISYAVFCLKKKKTRHQPVGDTRCARTPHCTSAHSTGRTLAGLWVVLTAVLLLCPPLLAFFFFFLKDPAPPEISPLPLPDALPI